MKTQRLQRFINGALLSAAALCVHAQSAAPSTIVLGTTAPFTGAFAEYGEEYRKGADACLAEINAAGGVRGRPIAIRYLDDGYEAARTTANARALAAQGVVGFVNLVGTGPLVQLAPLLDELKLPVFGMSSGAAQLRERQPGSRWLFHTKASYTDEFTGFAQVLPTIGMTRLVVVAQDNAFGKAGADSARSAFKAVGIEAPIVQLKSGDEGLQAAVDETQRAQPQVVVLAVAGAAAPAFIDKYQQAAGAAARVAVLSVVGGRLLTDKLHERARGIMTSLVYPSPWSGGRRVAREYQAAMKKSGQPLSMLSLEGCVNLRFAVEALKAAGDEINGPGLQRAAHRGLQLDLGDYALRLAPGGQVASTYTSLGIYRADGRVSE